MPPVAAPDPRDGAWTSPAGAGARALREWAALLSCEIAEMAVSSDAGDGFAARWRRWGLGPLELNLLGSTRQTVRHRARADAAPTFELVHARAGTIGVTHGGVSHGSGRALVPPGSFVLLDNTADWRLDFADRADCPTLHLPAAWLLARAPSAPRMAGQALGLRSPWGRPLAGLLTALADAGMPAGTLPRAVMADQAGALAGLLVELAEGEYVPDSPGLARRARAAIAEAAPDPDCDPAAIAAALGIGVRHLHRTLAREGTTFGRLLNETRIAAAEGLLAAPRRTRVGEVAFAVGYADPAHFARVFRAQHGCSPKEFQNRRRG